MSCGDRERQVLLRRQPNPYWHGKKPIVIAQTRPDLFEMVGVSETELVDDICSRRCRRCRTCGSTTCT
jgi:hypothetical protein